MWYASDIAEMGSEQEILHSVHSSYQLSKGVIGIYCAKLWHRRLQEVQSSWIFSQKRKLIVSAFSGLLRCADFVLKISMRLESMYLSIGSLPFVSCLRR